VVWLFVYSAIYVWGNNSSSSVDSFTEENSRVESLKELENMTLYNALVKSDQPDSSRLGFQDAATTTMEGIVDLHHVIMLLLIFLTVLVIWCVLASSFWDFWSKKIGGLEKEEEFVLVLKENFLANIAKARVCCLKGINAWKEKFFN